MIKHILIPTDGTSFSDRAVQGGIEFAKALGARVTGVHVIAPFHVFTYRSQLMLNYHMVLAEDSEDAYGLATEAEAARILGDFEGAAEEAGVRCKTIHVTDDQAFRAIIAAAKAQRCDMIAMASHGRGGVSGALLGNEANKVLTHSPIPVLIFR